MPSGWEKSPDYGGPPYRLRDDIVAWAVIILVGLFLAAMTLRPASSAQPRLTVVDGDTLKLGNESIRISNIDTPERGGRAECDAERMLAAIASRYAEEIVESGEFEIFREPSKDKYGRTLARVQVDGRDFGRAMIDRGVAVPWGGRQHDWCNSGEAED